MLGTATQSQQQSPLVEIKGLTTRITSASDVYTVVDDVSFPLHRGKTLALLGESGCGKSMTALSIMGLLPKPGGQVSAGQILLENDDLLDYSERQLRTIRGRRIGMIFQEPMTSLNPVLTVGQQIEEVLNLHMGLQGQRARARVVELLESVHIPDASHRVDNYPHQLSGGMKQRVMIALALAAEPELLIADEPTTALDVTTQAQVLTLLKSIQRERGMAILLITHDLGIVAEMADDVAVMYAGELVEFSARNEFFSTPRHPYSRALFAALPDARKRGHKLAVIAGQVPRLNQSFCGCRFRNRCSIAIAQCSAHTIELQAAGASLVRCLNNAAQQEPTELSRYDAGAFDDSEELLQVQNLRVHFSIRKGLFKRTVGYVYAVDGVSFDVRKGKTLALVGESGCGKTTVGKSIINLIDSTDGDVCYSGANILGLSQTEMMPWRRKMQFIFQDPFSSMNPRMQVIDIIAEGMKSQGMSRQQMNDRMTELLGLVGLDQDAKFRYPHEFSGGQRQRISIARALAVDPEFIVCDEPTSALDVSVQAQILNLLRDLQSQLGLSYLFITHNISVVAYLAEQVAVMYLGRIVEKGSVSQILRSPRHPYTQALLSAVPEIDDTGRERIILEGELPSAISPPTGCYFHQRCPNVMIQCRVAYPAAVIDGNGHEVSCFLYHNKGHPHAI